MHIDKLLDEYKLTSKRSTFCAALINIALTRSEQLRARTITLRNLLSSDRKLTHAFFKALEQHSSTLSDAISYPKQLSSSELVELQYEFNEQFRTQSPISIKREYRYRVFADTTLHTPARRIIEEHLKTLLPDQNFCIEKLLFENKLPGHSFTGKLRFWHIDNLKDQFKLFIPLDDVNSDGAMTFFPDTQTYTNLPADLQDKWKQVFDLALDSTSVANNFSDALIDSLIDSGHHPELQVLKAGDIALFSTRIIHSGTECRDTPRNSITIYLDVDTPRNRILAALH